MGFTIRKMTEEDIGQVQQVAKVSWHDTYKGIIPLEVQEAFLNAAYNNEMMQMRLKGFMFVAEVNDKVVGFANYSPVSDDGEAELAAIYIFPEYQGQGIGTALLEEGTKHLIGVTTIFINVEKDNEIGVNFYKAKDFQIVSEFEEDFGGHMLKTMRMVLNV